MSPPPHRLDPLLRPDSVAIVGASPRPGSMGRHALDNLRRGGYRGRIYPVNPRHQEIDGLACAASLEALPETPTMAIFAVSDERIEAALATAIAAGVGAVTIMSALVLAEDAELAAAGQPVLRERVHRRLAEAGVLCCGGNGMGFYNIRDSVWATGFDARDHRPPGNVTLLSQSGSGMCGILDCEERIEFNLAVSTGQELTVTIDRYLDFALDLPETRAVGLFLERARDPDGLRAALTKAQARAIPVVALKTGRTRRAAELAVSHCGAMAGDDAAYDALFDRYGVQRVRDMDELATALILLAQPHPPGPGGVVSLHDSGGERQLMVDLAHEEGVALTELTPETVTKLEEILDPGLPAVNPLDAWSRGGAGAEDRMAEALTLLLADPGAAIGLLVHDRAPAGRIYESYVDYLARAHAATGKPVALVASRQGTGSDPLVVSTTLELGFPVLDGVSGTLAGVRCMLGHRDFRGRPPLDPPPPPPAAVQRWRARIASGAPDSAATLAMLADFGLPVARTRAVSSGDAAVAAWREIGGPVALKTLAAEVPHRTEVGGVRLGLNERRAVEEAWHALSRRFGPRVGVSAMQPPGVEMLIGMSQDPDLGPVVALGMGGIHAEVLADVVFALPPFDATEARRLLGRLRLRPLLTGVRGAPAADIDALCDAAARFSVMVAAIGDLLREIDVNPVIAHAQGCVAVDALAVSAATPEREGQDA